MSWWRWSGAPRRIRVTALVVVAVLGHATVVHVVQLIGSGGRPYAGLPGALRGYFVSLTVLDPLAAVLLARRRRIGVVLAVAVLVSDAVANAIANYGLDPAPGLTAGRVGQAVVSMLALALVAVAPSLWRHCRPTAV